MTTTVHEDTADLLHQLVTAGHAIQNLGDNPDPKDVGAAVGAYVRAEHQFFEISGCPRCGGQAMNKGRWHTDYFTAVCASCRYVQVKAIPATLKEGTPA